jgi:hypothetical protein
MAPVAAVFALDSRPVFRLWTIVPDMSSLITVPANRAASALRCGALVLRCCRIFADFVTVIAAVLFYHLVTVNGLADSSRKSDCR